MIKIFALIMVAIAGVVHLIITPWHYEHAPAHGIFFAVSGIAQLTWVVIFSLRSKLWSYYLGLAVSGGLFVLWVFTQMWTPPFAEAAEAMGNGTIFTKIPELLAFLALIICAQKGKIGITYKLPRLITEALIISLVAGAAAFGAGYLAEPMFPSLYSAAHDGDGHGDDGHGDSDGGMNDPAEQSNDDHSAGDSEHEDNHADDEEDHSEGENVEEHTDGAEEEESGHDNDDGHHD